MGKFLILLGLLLVLLGSILTFLPRIPYLGKLPGDIRIERENFSFYFPLTTCLLFSMFFSFLFWLFQKK